MSRLMLRLFIVPPAFYNKYIEQFYIFFQGILLFQAFFLLILYFITNRKDVFCYTIFLFLSVAYFFLNAPYTFFGINEEGFFNTALYRNTNIPLIIITNLFYILFIKYFFAGNYKDKMIGKILNCIFGAAPLLVALFFILRYLEWETQALFYIINFLSAIVGLYYIIVVARYRLPNSGWVAWGMFFNIIGLATTILMIVLERNGRHNVITVGYPLMFMRVGILADMFLYQAAIIKKWNLQEKQFAVEKIDAQLEVEKFRNKMSRDLHDDLGATLSGISLYSHLAKTQLQSGNFTGVENALTVMQGSSAQMVNKLNDIIWFIHTDKSSLPGLIQRLEEYAGNMAAAKNMEVKVTIAEAALQLQLTMEHRRSIYLFCKEAINNAVKYSGGTMVNFTVLEKNGGIEFMIADNGKGLDVGQTSEGNGLKNMQQRADEVGAEFFIQTEKNKGCTVSLQFKTQRLL